MAKITLDDITSSFASTSLFQSNFTAIETELNDKVLYRNNPAGEANQMMNDLDMNSNDILNAKVIGADVLTLGGTQVVPTGTSELPALNVLYDNTTSGLTATTVQAAIDEVDADLDTAQADITANDVQLARGDNHGKNLIINGDFSVWQRGTSHTADGYTADRWNLQLSGATTTIDRQTHTVGQTDVPGNPKYFMRVDTTTSADFNRIENRIEGVETASGQEMTISFYAKGTNPGGGNFRLGIFQSFGTGGSPSTGVTTDITTTLAVTGSWVRYEYTFTVPSISGKTLGTDGNDYVRIQIGTAGDNSTDAWQLDISNVQLEFGDTATDFEYVNPAEQLANCQRYFERLGGNEVIGVGHAESTTSAHIMTRHSAKRAVPTVTYPSTITNYVLLVAGTNSTPSVAASSGEGLRGTQSIFTTTGLTAGEAVSLFLNGDTYIDIDSEL